MCVSSCSILPLSPNPPRWQPEGVPLLYSMDQVLNLSDDQLQKYGILYGLHVDDKSRNATQLRRQALARYIGCSIEMDA
jgi:hypothetical protein